MVAKCFKHVNDVMNFLPGDLLFVNKCGIYDRDGRLLNIITSNEIGCVIQPKQFTPGVSFKLAIESWWLLIITSSLTIGWVKETAVTKIE